MEVLKVFDYLNDNTLVEVPENAVYNLPLTEDEMIILKEALKSYFKAVERKHLQDPKENRKQLRLRLYTSEHIQHKLLMKGCRI